MMGKGIDTFVAVHEGIKVVKIPKTGLAAAKDEIVSLQTKIDESLQARQKLEAQILAAQAQLESL